MSKLPTNSKSTYHLSDITSAKWMMGGKCRISKKKFFLDENGDEGSYFYKIWTKLKTCQAVLSKQNAVTSAMNDVMAETKKSPFNIQLYDNRVVRISKLYGKLYIGLHILDEEGEVEVGQGINFSSAEFDNFCKMMSERKTVPKLTLKLSGPSGEPSIVGKKTGEAGVENPKKHSSADIVGKKTKKILTYTGPEVVSQPGSALPGSAIRSEQVTQDPRRQPLKDITSQQNCQQKQQNVQQTPVTHHLPPEDSLCQLLSGEQVQNLVNTVAEQYPHSQIGPSDGQGPADNWQIYGSQIFPSDEPVSHFQPGELKHSAFPAIPAIKYGWTWYLEGNGQYVSQNMTQGNWHFDKNKCQDEAYQFKPHGPGFKLDICETLSFIQIGKHLLDAAYAHLIIYNTNLWRELESGNYLHDLMFTSPENILSYGEQVKKRINYVEIHGLCRKVIDHYMKGSQKLPEMAILFMKQFHEYVENDILSLIKANKINQEYLELFQYIFYAPYD